MIEPLPAEAARVLEEEMEPGERLVWCGQPGGLSFLGASLPLFLFGLVFCGFSIFWVSMAWSATHSAPKNGGPPGGELFFPLFGVPFVLVGLCMVLSPLGALIRARRTFYGLTDRAAIVMRGKLLGGRDVTRYDASRLRDMTRSDRWSGRGDLVFERVASGAYWGRRNGYPVMQSQGFIGIDDVRDVERLVRTTLLS